MLVTHLPRNRTSCNHRPLMIRATRTSVLVVASQISLMRRMAAKWSRRVSAVKMVQCVSVSPLTPIVRTMCRVMYATELIQSNHFHRRHSPISTIRSMWRVGVPIRFHSRPSWTHRRTMLRSHWILARSLNWHTWVYNFAQSQSNRIRLPSTNPLIMARHGNRSNFIRHSVVAFMAEQIEQQFRNQMNRKHVVRTRIVTVATPLRPCTVDALHSAHSKVDRLHRVSIHRQYCKTG